ncbi:MAG: cysteine desulfurase [Lachnospiraceae bacterium]|nr:cysteine desulfurase [Lachnospiraceae bacterium]
MENLVYFDNAATTRMDTKVLEAMLPYLGASYGNASAKYSIGFEARKAVNTAREQVAALIGAYPDEIYFTSGATESNNIALRRQEGALITSEAEHPSVLNTARYCQSKGRAAAYIKPDMSGRIGADNLKKVFEGTAAGRTGMGLVSLMYVNNELGNVYPISELADTAHMHGWIFHTDAVQALGHLEIDVKKSGIDMLSASAHKLYGPKGIGLLYVRRGIKQEGLLKGGSQERGMRPGTENAAGIAGFGKACEIAKESMKENAVREKEIAGFLKEYILKNIPDSVQNGDGERILNFSFRGINGTSLALRLDMEGICVSTGSACSLGTEEISHVLRSIGLDETLAEGSLRISIGKYNTLDEAEYAAKKISELVSELRALTV